MPQNFPLCTEKLPAHAFTPAHRFLERKQAHDVFLLKNRGSVSITVLWLAEIGFTVFCVIWMKNHYVLCDIFTGSKHMIFGTIIKAPYIPLCTSFEKAHASHCRLGDMQQYSFHHGLDDHLVLL